MTTTLALPTAPLAQSPKAKTARRLSRLPSRTEVETELAYRSLFHFFCLSWSELEPTQQLVLNWHLEAICAHVQAALEDWIRAREAQKTGTHFEQRFQNLVINVPPGSSKSRILSVCAPAWMWLRYPSWRVLCLSSNPRVAMRDAMLCRDLIESPWYQHRFAPSWRLRDDQNAKSLYWTTSGGFRTSLGWFAKVTGDRADAIFPDDPHDAEEAKSDQKREAVLARWDSTISNRVSDASRSVRIGIMQRLHQQDWTGHVLSKGKGAWAHLCIEQEYEPGRRKADPDPAKNEIPATTVIGWRDPRTRAGELLDPVRMPPAVLEGEREQGSFYYAGQHQQRPAPLEGGIWKRWWWGYWLPPGIELSPVRVQMADGSWRECAQKTLPARFDFKCQSWDMAFGKSETSSMVVGQVWALGHLDRYLLDQVRAQLDFVETQEAFRALSRAWPDVEAKLVENKANGPAIISSLRGEFSGILAVEPDGDKVARAMAEQATIETGHVWLPHPGLFSRPVIARISAYSPVVAAMVRRALDEAERQNALSKGKKAISGNWVDTFVDEASSFPNGAFKDMVDTASQALRRLRKEVDARKQDDAIPHSQSGRSMFGRNISGKKV